MNANCVRLHIADSYSLNVGRNENGIHAWGQWAGSWPFIGACGTCLAFAKAAREGRSKPACKLQAGPLTRTWTVYNWRIDSLLVEMQEGSSTHPPVRHLDWPLSVWRILASRWESAAHFNVNCPNWSRPLAWLKIVICLIVHSTLLWSKQCKNSIWKADWCLMRNVFRDVGSPYVRLLMGDAGNISYRSAKWIVYHSTLFLAHARNVFIAKVLFMHEARQSQRQKPQFGTIRAKVCTAWCLLPHFKGKDVYLCKGVHTIFPET